MSYENWKDQAPNFQVVDVRHLQGNFFPGLKQKAMGLEVGEGFTVIQTFEPHPLYAAMEALGAAVTPMSYSEVFTSLQTKVIDGQENPCQNIWTDKFYEVQDYMTLTKHSYTVQIIGISEAYFQTLPEDVQQILIEEGHNLELRNREELEAIDNAQLEELKKVMDVYELSDEEYEAFRDIAATSWDAAKEAMGDEYFDLLMSEVEKAEAALKN